MLETTREVAELGRRISELGVMLTRTAGDERSPLAERETEVCRLVHLIRRRLDDCAAVSELQRPEADAEVDAFVAAVMKPYDLEAA